MAYKSWARTGEKDTFLREFEDREEAIKYAKIDNPILENGRVLTGVKWINEER